VLRVRFRFFDHWRGCVTFVRPPPYLQQALGVAELRAADLAEALVGGMAAARADLAAWSDDSRRDALGRQQFPGLSAERDRLDHERRAAAADPARRPEATVLWQRIKEVDRQMAQAQAEWLLQRLRLLDLAYYDSRGALLPWCLALGGEDLYQRLLRAAELTSESA